MKSLLHMPFDLYRELLAHLLPHGSDVEQAAFLFATVTRSPAHVRLDVVDAAKLTTSDFVVQCRDYLELRDETRVSLIKRAHELGASLLEMHSHPFPWPAQFSDADLAGLAETVPHMWWRLSKRPYGAVVVAPSGFDALLWVTDPTTPHALDGVMAGETLMRPTGRTLNVIRREGDCRD